MQCKFEGTLTLDPEQAGRMMPSGGPVSITEGEVLRIAARAVQLYAETHPRPTQVNQKQAAEMLGLSRHTVGNMVKTGQLKLNKCGMIPIKQIDAVLA